MGNHSEHVLEPNHLAMSQAEYDHHKSDVWKTTILLSIVTVGEVLFAIGFDNYFQPVLGWPKSIYAIVVIVLSLVKAGYIMAVFMHVKHEMISLILAVTLPFTLFIWMIISFMYDGDSWNNYNKARFGENAHPSVLEQNKGVTKDHH